MPGNFNFKRKAKIVLESALIQEEINQLVNNAKFPRVEADVQESRSDTR